MTTPSKIDKFNLHAITGSYGPKGIWSTYEGSFSNIQKCSIFVHHKNEWMSRNPMIQSEEYCHYLSTDIRNLCTIISKDDFLFIHHTMINLRHILIFATELVLDSLSNLITKSIGIKESNENEILSDDNIRYGIYQMNQALMYLHKEKNLIHGNICPDVILVTFEAQWKLAGLWNMDLSSNTEISNKPRIRGPLWLQNMDFIAPETVFDNNMTVASDMFSLGMLIISLYNDGRSLISSQQSLTIYSLQTMNINQNFDMVVDKLPPEVIESVEKMINSDPRYRPDTSQFSKCLYFKNDKTQNQIELNHLWTYPVKDQKSIVEKLLKNLNANDAIIRNGIFYRAVFRIMENENEIYPTTVNAVIEIVEICDSETFEKSIKPSLINYLSFLNLNKNMIVWLANMEKIIVKLSSEEIETYILPIWEYFINSEDPKFQKLSMDKLQLLLPYFNGEMISKSIYPSLVKIFQSTESIEMKNQVLEIIDKMITIVSSEYIIQNIYPFIETVQISDSKLLQNAINIYNHLLVKKNVMNIGILATKTTPTLLLETVNESLSGEQFRALMDLIHMIFDRISQDRISQYQKEGTLNFSIQDLENTYLYGSNFNANQKCLDTKDNNCSKDNNNKCKTTLLEESFKMSSSISYRRLSEQCHPKKQESQPLLNVMPDLGSRRHSCTLQNQGMDSLELSSNAQMDEFICRPTQSKPSSRRPSNSDSIIGSSKFESHSASGSRIALSTHGNENLGVFPEIRRSSFNSISNTVLDLFR